MKKIALASLILFLIACNNSKDNKDQTVTKSLSPLEADSLAIMEGHDVGMAKYGKLQSMQKQVQAALDSIAALPAKANEAAAPLKAQLESAMTDLKNAKEGMDKWMFEFEPDSAANNIDQRIKYFADEKMKVSKVKEDILGSIQKADSLLKSKS